MRHKYPFGSIFIRKKMLLPFLSGLILLSLTIALYWMTNQRDLLNIQKMTQAEANESMLDIESDLQDKTASIGRLARRWEIGGGTPKAEFVDEILRRETDFPGLNIVQRVDRMNQPLWIVPASAEHDMQALILSFASQYHAALHSAKVNRIFSMSSPLPLLSEGSGLVLYTPLFANHQYDGCVIEILNISQWLNYLLIQSKYPEKKDVSQFSLSVRIDGIVVYQQHSSDELADTTTLTAKSSLDLFKHHFIVTATPSKTFVMNNGSLIPEITLMGGTLLSALIAFIIYLLEKTFEQTRKLRLSERKYIRKANYDLLTGLPSRRLVEERIAYIISTANRSEHIVAIIFIDLDGFKLVNDTYGHHMGDLLLQEVAHRLSNSIRKSDTVARLGGDEFLVVLPDLKAPESAELIANKILHRLTQPITLLSEQVTIGASIGIAFFPQHGETSQALIKAADEAMYVVKKSGKNSMFSAPR